MTNVIQRSCALLLAALLCMSGSIAFGSSPAEAGPFSTGEVTYSDEGWPTDDNFRERADCYKQAADMCGYDDGCIDAEYDACDDEFWQRHREQESPNDDEDNECPDDGSINVRDCEDELTP